MRSFLGASWGRLGASWERLGTSWPPSSLQDRKKLEKPTKNHRFELRKVNPETLKIIDFPLVFHCFFDFRSFQHKYGFWMDFGASWGPPGHLLGRLGASWGRLGGVLAASWDVWECLGTRRSVRPFLAVSGGRTRISDHRVK